MGLEQLLTPQIEKNLEGKKKSKVKSANLKNKNETKNKEKTLFNEILKNIQKNKSISKQKNSKTIEIKSDIKVKENKTIKTTNKPTIKIKNQILHKNITHNTDKKNKTDKNENFLFNNLKTKALQSIKKDNLDLKKINKQSEKKPISNSLFEKLKKQINIKNEKENKDNNHKEVFKQTIKEQKNKPIVTTNLEKLKKVNKEKNEKKELNLDNKNVNETKTSTNLNEINFDFIDKSFKDKVVKDDKYNQIDKKNKKESNLNITSKKNIQNSLLNNLLKKANIKKQKTTLNHNKKDEIIKKQLSSTKNVEKRVLKETILNQTKQQIIENKSIEGVIKGAKKLNLSLEHIEIKKENTTKKETKKEKDYNNTLNISKNLNKIILNKQIISNQTNNKAQIISKNQSFEPKNSEKIEKNEQINSQNNNLDITIKVDKTLVEQFHTKIISAKQKMTSFMSDIARSIYANYKPPATSFRIRLNPVNLGQISVLIRTQKNTNNNSLEINLNISKQQTHEILTEHRHLLQQALNKNFSNNEISLNMSFGSDSNGSFNEYQNNQQNKNSKNKNKTNEKDNILDEIITYA